MAYTNLKKCDWFCKEFEPIIIYKPYISFKLSWPQSLKKYVTVLESECALT